MKKNTALSGVLLITLTATACGGGGIDTAWFEENCPTALSDVHENLDQDEPSGEVIGQAMTQGAITPPADLDSSEYARIGLYSQDDLSGAMTLEEEISSEDAFCLEPAIGQGDNHQRVDTREAEIEGDLHGDVYEVNFTLVRSPDYPEGIWMGLDQSGLPKAIEITEPMPEECALEWWAADETLEDAGEGEPVANFVVETAEDC